MMANTDYKRQYVLWKDIKYLTEFGFLLTSIFSGINLYFSDNKNAAVFGVTAALLGYAFIRMESKVRKLEDLI